MPISATEFRASLRSFRRDRLSVAAVIASLGLAIGIHTAVFALIYGVLLRELPYDDPERIVHVAQVVRAGGSGVWPPGAMSRLHAELSDDPAVFEAVSAFYTKPIGVALNAGPERAFDALYTSPDIAAVLGACCVLGRFWSPDEAARGENVAVVAESVWRHWLGEPGNLTTVDLRIEGASHQVVGVVADHFGFPDRTKIWLPLRPTDTSDLEQLEIVAKLAAGVSVPVARERIALRASAGVATSEQGDGPPIVVARLADQRSRVGISALVVPLMGITTILLIVALGNAGTVLLVRTRERAGEFAVRAALGAAPGRLSLTVLAEAAVLASLAGAIGVLLASLVLGLVERTTPFEAAPSWIELKLDWQVLALSTLPGVVGMAFVGWWPTRRATHLSISTELRPAGFGSTVDRGRRQIARAVTVLSVAATVLVLATTASLALGALAITRFDPGFRTAGVLRAPMAIPADGDGADRAMRSSFIERVKDAVAQLPGATSAAVEGIPQSPSLGDGFWNEIHTTGSGLVKLRRVVVRAVDPEYLRLLELPLVRGRAITADDQEGRLLVAVVNQSFVRRALFDADPIGQRLRLGASEEMEVVGVVGDMILPRSSHDFAGLDALPRVYLADAQVGGATTSLLTSWSISERNAADMLHTALLEYLPLLSRESIRTLDDEVAVTARILYWLTSVLLLVGVLGALVALSGLSAIARSEAIQRDSEFGIRKVLGASPWSIVKLAMLASLRLVSLGLLLGLVVYPFIYIWIRRFFFGPSEISIGGGLAIAVLVAVVALATAYGPARRAASMQPMAAIRARH